MTKALRQVDVQALLNHFNIEYVDDGPNVARGNVNIKCPYCGQGDPSHHLGVSLESGVWGCWRDHSHSGGSLVKLISAASGASKASIVSALKRYAKGPSTEEIDLDDLFDDEDDEETEVVKTIEMPKSLIRVDTTVLGQRVFDFLVSRGFTKQHVLSLIDEYDLRYAKTGEWAHRVVVPVRSVQGDLVNLTGRAIGKAKIRYKTLADSDEVSNIREFVLGEDQLSRDGGDVLYVVEGPFDRLKVDFYGQAYGKRAVCMFGSWINDTQVERITLLAEKFERVSILLDSGAFSNALAIAKALGHLNPAVSALPPGVSDPGELTERQVRNLR